MDKNETHEIIPKAPKPFNSLMELLAVVEDVLIEHGITLHVSGKAEKYIKNNCINNEKV